MYLLKWKKLVKITKKFNNIKIWNRRNWNINKIDNKIKKNWEIMMNKNNKKIRKKKWWFW